ncbi:MAG TPA: ABC transporter ATP-binding protein [Ktedonobacterales bacterium]|nr:ABC transporter ATP-binding protein [Ktedonobacterales bacterium]
MTSVPALAINNLHVQFGGIKAIDGLSCTIGDRTITGLIGPNGSGKTTLLNTITGMTGADAGSIVFDGHAIQGLKPHAIARHGIGRTFQITRLFPQMSVLDNLLIAQKGQKGERIWFGVLGLPSVRAQERQARDKALGFLDFTGLTRLQEAPAGTLSYGQQKLLEIARIMMLDPSLILLDEPFAGVNPTNVERLIAFIIELNRDRGITIVLVEHMMKIMMRVAQAIIVLKAGQVIATGTPAEVQVNPAAIEAYLGA